jgi:hypothetical protein
MVEALFHPVGEHAALALEMLRCLGFGHRGDFSCSWAWRNGIEAKGGQ